MLLRPLPSICVQAASYMRAVLRTLAQCHARRILHRDVKVRCMLIRLLYRHVRQLQLSRHVVQAKNFMLLNDSETR